MSKETAPTTAQKILSNVVTRGIRTEKTKMPRKHAGRKPSRKPANAQVVLLHYLLGRDRRRLHLFFASEDVKIDLD
jgi:hypothetical protein